MSIYDKSTKELMRDFANQNLKKGQLFTRQEVVKWFAQHYPKIKSNTVSLHVNGMSVQSPLRKHHPNIRPGSGHDLFIKVGQGTFRLWEPDNDPPPVYMSTLLAKEKDFEPTEIEPAEEFDDENGSSSEFAYENDLKNYLGKNLHLIESGLKLYEEEGFSGIEFPAGGRYIDLLAVDKKGDFVVIELKVSKGYDRVIGQLLRYMSWIEKNLAGGKNVRGVIVASNISEDLKLATSRLNDVGLFEYELSFQLKKISY